MANNAVDRIFTVNLGAAPDEKVIVLTDIIDGAESPSIKERERRDDLRELAKEVAEAGKKFCRTEYLEYPAPEEHGCEPPALVWRAAFGADALNGLNEAGILIKLLDKKAGEQDIRKAEEIIKKNNLRTCDAVVALSNFSTSHTRFRDLLTRIKGVRYASMPLFERQMLDGSMTANWTEVDKRTMRLVEKFKDGETVFITSHNGTSINFSIKGRELKPDTGILTKPGSFGNLPAGEAYLAPVEGTAVGTLILEYAPAGRLKNPVTLEVKNGRVIEVAGKGGFARELRARIKADPLCGNIAELGIGTNEKATRPDNILETEKILGTVHIALGDNSSFGGKVSVPFHEDFIFLRPTLEVIKGEEKTEILVEGEPRF